MIRCFSSFNGMFLKIFLGVIALTWKEISPYGEILKNLFVCFNDFNWIVRCSLKGLQRFRPKTVFIRQIFFFLENYLGTFIFSMKFFFLCRVFAGKRVLPKKCWWFFPLPATNLLLNLHRFEVWEGGCPHPTFDLLFQISRVFLFHAYEALYTYLRVSWQRNSSFKYGFEVCTTYVTVVIASEHFVGNNHITRWMSFHKTRWIYNCFVLGDKESSLLLFYRGW